MGYVIAFMIGGAFGFGVAALIVAAKDDRS
jgi:hypothetical protein